MNGGTMEGQTIAGRSRLVDYSNLVKLPHTVFALPFALVGATLASYRYPVRPAGPALDPGGVHRRPLRGDGVQPHRGSGDRRAEPAHARRARSRPAS